MNNQNLNKINCLSHDTIDFLQKIGHEIVDTTFQNGIPIINSLSNLDLNLETQESQFQEQIWEAHQHQFNRRAQVGKNQEEIELDDNIKTISDLISHLQKINENYKDAFNDLSTIRFSKNMNLVNIGENISNNDEIAFFPPMTGG